MQIPVPPCYVTRLQIIHAIVTKTVYTAKATVTSIETSPDKFKGFMTIADSTLSYNCLPQKNAASVQALTIYYCLKQITNVLGYQIIDLNYPILAQLITSLSTLTLHIGLLEECILYVTHDTTPIYIAFRQLLDEHHIVPGITQNTNCLYSTLNELHDSMQNFYNTIIYSSDEFMNLKVIQKQAKNPNILLAVLTIIGPLSHNCILYSMQGRFLSASLHTESLTSIPDRWTKIDKPGNFRFLVTLFICLNYRIQFSEIHK